MVNFSTSFNDVQIYELPGKPSGHVTFIIMLFGEARLYIQQLGLSIIWSHISGHLANLSPIFYTLLALFLVSTTSKGKYLALAKYSNYFCLLFGSDQVLYR